VPYEIKKCRVKYVEHDPHPWGDPVKGAVILQYQLHCPGVDLDALGLANTVAGLPITPPQGD
jgi:hypothetical protein